MSFDSLLDSYKTRLVFSGTNIRKQYINLLENSLIEGFEDNINYRKIRYKKANGRKYFLMDAHILQVKSDTEIVGLDDYKRVIFKDLNFKTNKGDMLRFGDNNWIVLRISNTDFIKSCIIGRCNNVINLYKNNVKHEYSILVEDQIRLYQLGIEVGKYITEPSSIKIFYISSDNITRDVIKRGEIYKVGMDNYRIIDVDDILNPGILIVKCEFSQQEQEIPIENKQPHASYVINGNDEIYVERTSNYQAIKYINGEIDTDAEFEFSIHGDTPKDKYTLTIIDKQNCSIEAKSYPYMITLHAIDINEDSEDNYIEKEILLRGLF